MNYIKLVASEIPAPRDVHSTSVRIQCSTDWQRHRNDVV